LIDSCDGTKIERDQPDCCDDCPLTIDCGEKGTCGALNILYPLNKPSLITKVKNIPLFAAKVVENWLSSQPGNAKFEERFYYALGVKAPEWLETWDDEYTHKHEYYFKRWVEETKEELGLDE